MLFACCCLLRHWLPAPSPALLSAVARGQLKDKCTGRCLEGRGQRVERVKKKKTEREWVRELRRLDQERNRMEGGGAICLGSSRTSVGLLKEMF